MTADYLIRKLDLTPHPEGGYFRETFAAADIIETDHLERDFNGSRKAYTSIYFLLKSDQVSHLHRLKSDELWNYHSGSPLTIHIIDKEGGYTQKKVGLHPDRDESFQQVVKAGCWFGATVDDEDSYALVGCVVSPGFEFEDFELGGREELIRRYPQHRSIIQKLTLT
jgi:predicted cupin superfamily sugar epimerase